MNNELNNSINLVIGDWSHDGHEISETVTIKSNLTGPEINDAYEAGTKKVGFNLVEGVACDWQDNSITSQTIDSLKRFGFNPDDVFGDYECSELESQGKTSIYRDEFVTMYLFIAGLGNLSFQYEIQENHDNTLHIGGYGLYDL